MLDGTDVAAAPSEQAHRLRRRAEPGRRQGRRAWRRRSAWRSRSDGTTLYVAAFGSSTVGVFDTAAAARRHVRPRRRRSHIARQRRRTERPGARRAARAALRADPLRQLGLGDRHRRAAPRSTTSRCTIPSRRTSSTAGRSSTTRVFTSSNGEASCASCHVFGDFDSLAWDLGNPDDVGAQQPEPVPRPRSARHVVPRPPPDEGADDDAEPARHGQPRPDALARRPHRRQRSGRRRARRERGVPASSTSPSTACSGAAAPISDADMQAFTDFILEVTYPPNPIRALDNSLTAGPGGRPHLLPHLASRPTSSRPATAATCSIRRTGFFGSDGFSSFEFEPQNLKIPHLRNLYQKVGMFGMPAIAFVNPGDNGHKGDQVRGFGFLHDGSIDTVFRFHNATRVQPDESGRLPDPQPGRLPERRRRRSAAPPGRGLHAGLRQQPRADRRPAGDAARPARRRRSAAGRQEAAHQGQPRRRRVASARSSCRSKDAGDHHSRRRRRRRSALRRRSARHRQGAAHRGERRAPGSRTPPISSATTGRALGPDARADRVQVSRSPSSTTAR